MSAPRQRLIVCLDGTWNNRDDSTNVLHQSILSLDGQTTDGWVQRVYYDEGVGNGVLDGITGGGFGIGLEENVREAYNWLVEHFNDTGGGKNYEADEIYIFGFSRGAYTARSLVGFIGRCGLLRRGAPLTVNELWSAYCLLGRQHEERTSVWDLLAPAARAPFRQISAFVPDPWSRKPGDLPQPANPAEKQLAAWSRRARITYLGLYDTVGAMGLDALAIPGLRSRIALHHNMRPTTLIQRCRHALAIEEHRRSFNHTPFVAFYGDVSAKRQLMRGEQDGKEDSGAGETKRREAGAGIELAPPAADNGNPWARNEAMWKRKIEQCWFVGAHSNIGGGYESNVLAQTPFAWVLEGAKGLELKPGHTLPEPPPPGEWPGFNDSYTNFAAPLAIHLLRLKRHYRAIAPPEDTKAAPDTPSANGTARDGFSLRTINETVHASVLEYYHQKHGRALPPNLACLKRARLARVGDGQSEPSNPTQAAGQAEAAQWRSLAGEQAHAWDQLQALGPLWSPLWGAFAAVGLQAVTAFFSGGLVAVPLWLLLGAAAGFVLVDWLESSLNFALALEGPGAPKGARCRAAKDSIYWTRSIAVTLALIGIATSAFNLLATGWHAPSLLQAWGGAVELAKEWSPVLAVAAAATLVGAHRQGLVARHWLALAAPPLAAAGLAGTIVLTWLVRRLLGLEAPPMLEPPTAEQLAPAALAGQVLLLQLGFVYFFRAFLWVGEPLSRANLPSIVQLQRCATPGAVAEVLENWRSRLATSWRPEDKHAGPAAGRMRTLAREALWRDIIGFIPVYGLVLGYGLWLASRWLAIPSPFPHWLNGLFGPWPGDLWNGYIQPAATWLGAGRFGLPHWLWLTLIGAAADYLENIMHLGYLRRHGAQAPSQPAGQAGPAPGQSTPAATGPRQPNLLQTAAAFLATAIKFAVFIPSVVVSLGVVLFGSWRLFQLGTRVEWRGSLAMFLTLGTLMMAAGYVAARIGTKFVNSRRNAQVH